MPRIGSQGNNARQLRHAWRLSLLLLLLSVVVLGVIVFASAEFDAAAIRTLMGRISPALIVSLLLLSCVNFALRSGRWIWFTSSLGLPVPWTGSAACYVGGFAMGVTPGRIGELIRLWQLRRDHGISYHRALPLLIGDRISDLIAVIVLALGAGLMTTGAPLPAVLAAAAVVLLANAALRHPGYLIKAINGLYGATRRGARAFAAARRTLRTGRVLFSASNSAITAVISLAAWFAECIAFFALLSALDTGVTLAAATFVYSFATLVGALSFLPGGLGGFEATAVVMLGAWGVDLGSAAFATTVIRLTTLWFSVALGGGVLAYSLFGRKFLHE